MFYKKIKESGFKASDHFQTFMDQITFPTYHLSQIQKREKITTKQRISQAQRHLVKYLDFIEINKIWNSYIDELKGNLVGDAFLPLLFKAELTGAEVIICGEKRRGYVVEERVNVIVIVSDDDKVRIYPKELYNFIILHKKDEYKFFGKMMKKSRFSKLK